MMIREERLATIRKSLESERADLQAQLDSLSVEKQDEQSDDGDGGNISDEAADLMIRERNMALSSNAHDLLEQVNAALVRLDAGVYGICARCDEEISTERLEVLPYATMCVRCQSLVEA